MFSPIMFKTEFCKVNLILFRTEICSVKFLSTLRHCAGEKVKNWHFLPFLARGWKFCEWDKLLFLNFEFWIVCHLCIFCERILCAFIKGLNESLGFDLYLSFIFYWLQLHCFGSNWRNFRIITLRFFYLALHLGWSNW